MNRRILFHSLVCRVRAVWPFIWRSTLDRQLCTQAQTYEAQIEGLHRDLQMKDNVVRWLRWKVYGGTEPPGHRPISGFTSGGAPIFKGPGTPFWAKKRTEVAAQ